MPQEPERHDAADVGGAALQQAATGEYYIWVQFTLRNGPVCLWGAGGQIRKPHSSNARVVHGGAFQLPARVFDFGKHAHSLRLH